MADFVWGPGGTEEDPRARRRLAEALIEKGTSAEPIRSPWQGLARVAQALTGSMMQNQEDQRQREGTGLLLQNPAFGGAAPDASQPTAPGGVSPMAGDVPKSLGGDPAASIASIESGGKYDLLGPVTRTGDRAYGKYQVMGANVPAWTKAHLGQEMTPEQFVQNPQAQDAVFKGQFGQYAKKYGNEGAARAWFAGEGGMNNPNARDQLGTTVSAYADKFNRGMGEQPARVASAGGMPTPDAPATQVAAPVQVAQAGQSAPQLSGPASQAGGIPGARPMPPAVADYVRRLIANPYTRAAGISMLGQYTTPRDAWTQQAGADGKILQRNSLTGEMKVVDQGDKTPPSVLEYQYYKKNAPPDSPPMDYATWATAKARAGATNIANNVDMNSGQTYDKLLAEGLGKSHAALSNDVEGAQSRARDLAAMQGAVDTIQKNGGTTGGLGQAQIQDLKKTLNVGANALGITTPFNENDISDKEFLQKFNRQMAGAQAKGAVGSRVTNFEMANYLKANPGLDMSITGNQRLIGIQSQIEQRNIAVGNQIRQATAQAIAKGQKIDPVTVQKIITDYDEAHHVTDPVNNQDLTQNYTLPEFQGVSSNSSMAVGHEQNIGGIKIKRVR